MAEKKIIVNIDENGTIDAETFEMQGVECLTELDKLLKDLALQTETIKKDDYFKESVSNKELIKVKK